MPKYGVARHIAWGEVGGELFEDESLAMRRFAELNGGGCAAMLLSPEGRELRYYGCRGGREDEMRQWWRTQDCKTDGKRTTPTGYEPVKLPKLYTAIDPAPIDCLVIGAGARGCTYAEHPGLRPVAIADPNAARCAKFSARHSIPENCQFQSWEEAMASAQNTFKADVCIVATPDQLHIEPALAACERFKGLLLEKPMAVTEDDCRKIAEACKSNGTICAVCHVLRYSFANAKVHELIQSGSIGEVLSICHTEPVGYYHFAHSFVRGNWRNESESTNSLLAKCCHDIDLIASWMEHERCVSVSSFGSLQHFRQNKKPKEARDAMRCLDCPINGTCAYSASRLYLDSKHAAWARHLVDAVVDIESITEALKTGPYGRCVYECDNDVCDRQVVNFQFESGATAHLTMIATTERLCQRETKVYGSAGELSTSDESKVRHVDFRSQAIHEYRPTDVEQARSKILVGHGGADELLINAFIVAIRTGDKSRVLTGPEESLKSHRLAFAAEKSRKSQQVVYCE